ncbi:MAG: site-specific integrase [Lachnospiraceae bacterium]|nr:site-specific integrase [Lachnospiraceae bacterium]
MRKTYASMCNAKGVPIDFIREQLGHSSLSTTYGYIYNPLTEEESYNALTRALSSTPEAEEQDVGKVIDIASKKKEKYLSPTCPHLSPKFRAK